MSSASDEGIDKYIFCSSHMNIVKTFASCKQPTHFWNASEPHKIGSTPTSSSVFTPQPNSNDAWLHDSPHSTSGAAHLLLRQYDPYRCYLPQKSDPVYSGSNASTMDESVHIIGNNCCKYKHKDQNIKLQGYFEPIELGIIVHRKMQPLTCTTVYERTCTQKESY